MSEEKNDLLFFVNTDSKQDFVIARIGYTQTDLDKMQSALDAAPEKEKGKIANIDMLVAKSGEPYAKINSFVPKAPSPSNVSEASSVNDEDDLPF